MPSVTFSQIGVEAKSSAARVPDEGPDRRTGWNTFPTNDKEEEKRNRLASLHCLSRDHNGLLIALLSSASDRSLEMVR
ncbi:hypothetical protein CEXT_58371 [Caerostris extrusa]|uniref:Uncharacterized protein n=1 Tax=Caerostris extrusa TaxID=172846 RepID=A0AAV4S0Q6_CAEEX|nr:hypothetical protein CEXT_58371 [Caerostris extrusa]